TITRIASQRTAFLSAMAIASGRTLLMFETKFVDEVLAIVLFSLMLFVLLLDGGRYQRSILLTCAMVPLALAHHVISMLTVLFLFVWTFGAKILDFKGIPNRFRTKPETIFSNIPTPLYISVFIILVSMFVYFAEGLTAALIGSLYNSLFMGSFGKIGGIRSSETTIRTMLASSSAILLALFSVICAYGVLSKNALHKWTYGWIGFAGIVMIFYAAILMVGRVIALDPIRLYIIITFTLIPAALNVLESMGYTERSTSEWKQIIPAVLVSLFVVTQLAAIPPHVLYSNPSETTPYMEGHYTPAQFEAADWVMGHTDGTVYGYEAGFWEQAGVMFTGIELYNSNICAPGDLLAIRNGTREYSSLNRVYDSLNIGLYSCSY
ncbi:MAG: hypothetical protein ABEI86_02915, partial [Halobacteriaceae archaeon]